MAIGKHTAAAIQNVGGIIGGAMEKKATIELQEEETRRKEALRQQERAEDREWQEKKLDASMQVSAAKDAATQQRHEESLAAAKERNLQNIASREKIAADKAGSGSEYKPGQRLDDIRSDIRREQEKLTNIYSLQPGEADTIKAKLAALEAEYTKVYREATGKEDPKVPGDIRFDKGLVGSQLVGDGEGALRPAQGDKSSAKGDNSPRKINTQEEYDALPKGAIYIDPDDGKKYRKP